MTRTTIECHPSGTYFDFAAPTAEMVHVEDIARALSQINRFGGHTRWPYSVAQHALLVHRLVRDVAGPELSFAALHHDSHEAYLGDIPTPLKELFRRSPEFDVIADKIDWAIVEKFGIVCPIDGFHHDIVKAADEQALFIEASVLKLSRGVGPQWGHDRTQPWQVPTGAVQRCEPEWAEHLFLAAHRRCLSDLGVGV